MGIVPYRSIRDVCIGRSAGGGSTKVSQSAFNSVIRSNAVGVILTHSQGLNLVLFVHPAS